VPTPNGRLRVTEPTGHILVRKRLQEVGTLFTPDTILRWHRTPAGHGVREAKAASCHFDCELTRSIVDLWDRHLTGQNDLLQRGICSVLEALRRVVQLTGY
jgi:hypothetical protein